jgi:hypothetical protein
MVEQSSGRTTMEQGHVQRAQDQLGGEARPSDLADLRRL